MCWHFFNRALQEVRVQFCKVASPQRESETRRSPCRGILSSPRRRKRPHYLCQPLLPSRHSRTLPRHKPSTLWLTHRRLCLSASQPRRHQTAGRAGDGCDVANNGGYPAAVWMCNDNELPMLRAHELHDSLRIPHHLDAVSEGRDLVVSEAHALL